jgi:hypothetical protein
MSKKVASNDKALENINARMDTFASTIKNQHSFNKMLELSWQMLGEKFRSDDTIHTIIRKISSKTKLRTKLYSLSDRTIHVRGSIYMALVFVFYIK